MSHTITTSQRQSLTRAIVRRFGGRAEDLRFVVLDAYTRRVENDATGASLDADFTTSRMQVIDAHAGDMVAQPAQQPQADASPAAPAVIAADDLRPETREIVEAVAASGFDVYMRAARDTYLYFTDGAKIGYLEFSRGYIRRATVHVPNCITGTGYGLDDGFTSPPAIDRAWLSHAFINSPCWASARDRDSVRKYRDFEVFAASNAWGGGLKLVAPAGLVLGPAMVAQPAQQPQSRDARAARAPAGLAFTAYPADVQAEALTWAELATDEAPLCGGVHAYDDGVREGVDKLIRRGVIGEAVGGAILALYDVPAMVRQPVQQQQAYAAMGQAARPVQESPATTRDDITTRTLDAHCKATGIDHSGSHHVALYHVLCDVLTLCDAKRIDFDALLSEVRTDLVQEAADRAVDGAEV